MLTPFEIVQGRALSVIGDRLKCYLAVEVLDTRVEMQGLARL